MWWGGLLDGSSCTDALSLLAGSFLGVFLPIGKVATVEGERGLGETTKSQAGWGGRSGGRRGGCLGRVGEERTTEPGSLLRKHAKNAVGSWPVGQDHKEAFVLGGVQGVDGQNSREGAATLLGE